MCSQSCIFPDCVFKTSSNYKDAKWRWWYKNFCSSFIFCQFRGRRLIFLGVAYPCCCPEAGAPNVGLIPLCLGLAYSIGYHHWIEPIGDSPSPNFPGVLNLELTNSELASNISRIPITFPPFIIPILNVNNSRCICTFQMPKINWWPITSYSA